MAWSILASVSDFICIKAMSTSVTKSSTLCSSASRTTLALMGRVSRNERSLKWTSLRRSSSISLSTR